MEQITERQALLFVKAGIFPEAAETQSVIRLQDIFGKLRYRFVNGLLADNDTETRENALRLYKILWDDTQVSSMVKSAERYIREKKEFLELQKELEEKQKRAQELERNIKSFEI